MWGMTLFKVSALLQVLGLTSNVRKMFKDMDEALYEECRLSYEAEEVSNLQCWYIK